MAKARAAKALADKKYRQQLDEIAQKDGASSKDDLDRITDAMAEQERAAIPTPPKLC